MKGVNGSPRSATTLIELIVVITIIGLLAAITAGALFRLQASSRERTAKETLEKLQMALDVQWKAVVDQSKKDIVPDEVMILAGSDNRRARVLHTLFRLRQEFPQTVYEATTPPVLNPVPPGLQANSLVTYYPANSAFNAAVSANAAPVEDQRAVLLMIILSQSRGGASSNGELIGGNARGSKMVNGVTYPVFVDAWGQAIGFKRAATNADAGLVDGELNLPPYTAGTGFNNASDPEGLLQANNWPNPLRTPALRALNVSLTSFGNFEMSTAFDNKNRGPFAYSGGRNKVIGDGDDLHSFRIRGRNQAGN